MYALLLAASLTAPQTPTASILKAIDNICGDTWCEGEYSYRFRKVNLDSTQNTTHVLFTMSLRDPLEIDSTAVIRKQSFDVTCNVSGYSTLAAIMDNGDQLNWDFYTSLTDCIQKLEDRLSRVNRP